MRALPVRVDHTHPQAAYLPSSYDSVFAGIMRLSHFPEDPDHVLNVLAKHSRQAEAEGWPPAVVMMTVVSLWHKQRYLGDARNYQCFVKCIRNHAEQTLVAFGLDPEETLGERR